MGRISRTKANKDKVLKALSASLGNITVATKGAGVSRRVFYKWIKNDKKFAEAVDEIENECGDWVESKLMQLIKGGDVAATIFYLKTRLKNRGYSERHEVTGADGTPFVSRRLTQSEAREFLRKLDEEL